VPICSKALEVPELFWFGIAVAAPAYPVYPAQAEVVAEPVMDMRVGIARDQMADVASVSVVFELGSGDETFAVDGVQLSPEGESAAFVVPIEPAENDRVYWHVESYSATGELLSTSQTFWYVHSEVDDPPSAPVLDLSQLPAETLRPSFWIPAGIDPEGALTAVEFRLSSSNDSAFERSSYVAAGDSVHFVYPFSADLPEHTEIEVTARSITPDGEHSEWVSESWFVRGPNDPPAAPGAPFLDEPYRPGGENVVRVDPVVDPEGDLVLYTFTAINPESTDVRTSDFVIEPEWVLPELSPGEWFVSVRAYDPGGASTVGSESLWIKRAERSGCAHAGASWAPAWLLLPALLRWRRRSR